MNEDQTPPITNPQPLPTGNQRSWSGSKKIIIPIILITIVVGLFYRLDPLKKFHQSPVATTKTTPEPPITHEWHVQLEPQGGSGVKGLAYIFETAGKTTISVYLDPSSSKNPKVVMSAIMPAHIDKGSCPNPIEIKFPLTNIVSVS